MQAVEDFKTVHLFTPVHATEIQAIEDPARLVLDPGPLLVTALDHQHPVTDPGPLRRGLGLDLQQTTALALIMLHLATTLLDILIVQGLHLLQIVHIRALMVIAQAHLLEVDLGGRGDN